MDVIYGRPCRRRRLSFRTATTLLLDSCLGRDRLYFAVTSSTTAAFRDHDEESNARAEGDQGIAVRLQTPFSNAGDTRRRPGIVVVYVRSRRIRMERASSDAPTSRRRHSPTASAFLRVSPGVDGVDRGVLVLSRIAERFYAL